MYKISKIDNGARIATYRMPEVQTAAIGVWVGVGGRFESAAESGISHFIEHLAFKGTETRTMRQIKESIEGVGGVLNAFTSEEVTCYLAKVLFRHMTLATEVILDLVLNCLLKQQDINKERNVIFEEIKMYFDLPQHLAFDQLLKLLWPKNALGRNLAGTFKTLKNLERKHIIGFKESYYTPENILITACGNISHSKFEKIVRSFFLRHYEKKIKISDNRNISKLKIADTYQDKARLKILNKETQQTQLCFGLRSLKREDSREYAQTLMHIILGANMSSRLFNEVREKKGYAYDIGTGIKKFADTGAFFIHAGVIKESAEYACKIILKELMKIKKQLVTDAELSRAKEFYFGQMLMSLEDPLERMVWFGGDILKIGRVKTTKELICNINKVKKNEICELARFVFNNQVLNLSVVGPVTKKQIVEFNEILKGF